MTRHYILGGPDGHTPIPVPDTQIGDYNVSTVFLWLDHGWGMGPPVLFETMIFYDEGGIRDMSGAFEGYQERYGTWDEAQAGHDRACAMVREMYAAIADVTKINGEPHD